VFKQQRAHESGCRAVALPVACARPVLDFAMGCCSFFFGRGGAGGAARACTSQGCRAPYVTFEFVSVLLRSISCAGLERKDTHKSGGFYCVREFAAVSCSRAPLLTSRPAGPQSGIKGARGGSHDTLLTRASAVSLGSLLTKVGLTLQGHGYGDNSLHSSDNFSLFANPCRRNIQSPPHTKKVELPAYLAPPASSRVSTALRAVFSTLASLALLACN